MKTGDSNCLKDNDVAKEQAASCCGCSVGQDAVNEFVPTATKPAALRHLSKQRVPNRNTFAQC